MAMGMLKKLSILTLALVLSAAPLVSCQEDSGNESGLETLEWLESYEDVPSSSDLANLMITGEYSDIGLYLYRSMFSDQEGEAEGHLTEISYQELAEDEKPQAVSHAAAQASLDDESAEAVLWIGKEQPVVSDEYEVYIVGAGGIALLTHTGNPVNNITMDELIEISDGEIGDWENLGGKKGEVSIGTHDYANAEQFSSLIYGIDSNEIPEKIEELPPVEQDTRDYFYLREEPGYSIELYNFSRYQLDVTTQSYLSPGMDQLAAMAVDGIPFGYESIANGSYPLSHRVYLIGRKEADWVVRFVDMLNEDREDAGNLYLFLVAADAAVPVEE